MTTAIQDWVAREAAKHGGITPAQLVTAARNPKSPGHACFEWDDTIAAQAHRLTQASSIIRSLTVAYSPASAPDELRTIRAYWPDSSHGASKGVYKAIEAIAADPVASAVLLAEMEREWRAFRRRWGHMAEFLDLIADEVAA